MTVKAKFKFLLVLFWGISVISCLSRRSNSFVESEQSTSWLNESYIKCMESKLPCECQSYVKPFSLIRMNNFSGNELSLDAMGNGNGEFINYKLINERNNIFTLVLNYEDSISKIGTLIIEKNFLLFLSKDNQTTKYLNIPNSINNESDDDFLYQNYNVILINKALKNRAYPSLEQILNVDSLKCDCTDESLNLIFRKDSKSWLIEQKNDSLYLYNFENNSKSIIDHKNKIFLKGFKW